MTVVEGLCVKLIRDLRLLGIDTDGFTLLLKPFSKSYYGRYKVQIKQIVVYIYSDKDCKNLIPYDRLFETTLHEAIHHIQWSSKDFKRIKGVMHNKEFYLLYNRYLMKYRIYKLAKHRRFEL